MMSLWDPFADIARVQSDLFRAARLADDTRRGPAFLPTVDIVEAADGIVLRADLPGVRESDLSIRVEDGVLTIEGERKSERRDDKASVHRIERSYGKFTRSFSLPKSIDAAAIEASLADGVLTLRLPKRTEVAPRKIAIKVSGGATTNGATTNGASPEAKAGPVAATV
jgi:HSP20 family protein